MRRVVPLLIVGVLVAVATVALRSGGPDRARVEAVFDTAKGVVPGQRVKIAGVVAGTVRGVDLMRGSNAGYRAVMKLDIDRRFMPFRPDASCKILPEGLISENYVECKPGVAPGALPRGPGGRPTIPVERTATPLSLQDVINVFSMPTSQRLRLVINELGLGTAGRGEDLNQILRRANPALTQARRVLTIVDAQADDLGNAVAHTDRVLSRLGRGERSVREFVGRAATVARTTEKHKVALGQTVRRLPAALRAIDGALAPMNRVVSRGTPLLDDVRAAAPALNTLTKRFPVFADEADPALRAVGAAAEDGLRTISPARPVVAHLRTFAKHARPVAKRLDQLLVSTRDKGGIEGTLRTAYGMATGAGYYDEVSHFIAVTATLWPECILANTRGVRAPGCSHAYTADAMGRAPMNAPNVDPGPLTADATRTKESRAAAGRRRKPARVSERDVKYLLDFLLK